MTGDSLPDGHRPPRWLFYAVALGLYLTLRGYHSFDGDQAYRLPLLLHWRDPGLFADDPFVQAFDAFNPHRGSFIVLDVVTRPLGLALGLFVVFVATFGATCMGVNRVACGSSPGGAPIVGAVAIGLVLAAKAGNIGTNHLFEAMVLDRLMAFALGWVALARVVLTPHRSGWLAFAALGGATLVHPSVGLQFAIVIGASWAVWFVLGRWTKVDAVSSLRGLTGLAVAVLPGLAVNLGSGSTLMGDMPDDLFWLLSVELQSPQHMLPHLWRMPQWLACGCYLALAAMAITDHGRSQGDGSKPATDGEMAPESWPPPRLRLVVTLAVILIWLGAAWYAIEMKHNVRVTVFQPFRMATLARGIALVLIAGRVVRLWRTERWLGRLRAALICVSVVGDWLIVVVTAAELAVSATETLRGRLRFRDQLRIVDVGVLFAMLALGLYFLGHHDTEYGHIPLLATLGTALLAESWGQFRRHIRIAPPQFSWTPARLRALFVCAWIMPAAALLAATVPPDHAVSRHPISRFLVNRCRFTVFPNDDIERLALWCRGHTPTTARFIGPPGPKTFRLWSSRNLAFNRSASPYHATGLSDWFARFQDHVDFHGSAADFVRAYQADRHGFEARYQALDDVARAALALRQGATHVVAAAPPKHDGLRESAAGAGPLELLHVEGDLAVYRVRFAQLVQRQR